MATTPKPTKADLELLAARADTAASASEFLRAYRRWTRDRDAGLRCPELIIKAARARELAGLNYWQMPFAAAICREEFSGLTLEKWTKARNARGIK